jgi:hypothetical protein
LPPLQSATQSTRLCGRTGHREPSPVIGRFALHTHGRAPPAVRHAGSLRGCVCQPCAGCQPHRLRADWVRGWLDLFWYG